MIKSSLTPGILRKRFWLSVYFLGFFLFSSAQSVDSSYHNYLYDNRSLYFSQLPTVNKAVIFFGDSITQWGDWGELFRSGNILNRGIAGDNTFGLMARVGEVIRHRPKKVFILIGTNDINLKIPNSYIIRNYVKIIQAIKSGSPTTKIIIQSVFPINNQLIGRKYYTGTNEQISELNKELEAMAEKQQVIYVDVYSALLENEKVGMKADYTYDGLHLSGSGYLAWRKVLKTKRLL